MTLREALNASLYETAELEVNNLYCIVDGSLLDGEYSIKSGVIGMPVNESRHVESVDAAIAAVQDLDLPPDGWTPVEEDA